MIDLGFDVNYVNPTALNDSGQIAGQFLFSGSLSGGEVTHAFLDSGGAFLDLGSLGGQYTYVTSLNNSGEVVGYSYLSNGGWHAFLYSNGTMTDLGTLSGGSISEAWGINDFGQIVGNSGESAILYSGGVMYDLNTLIPADTGWQLVNAIATNDAGQITGWGYYNGKEAAFLLTPQVTPVPEPGYRRLLLSCLVGASLVNLCRLRRRTDQTQV